MIFSSKNGDRGDVIIDGAKTDLKVIACKVGLRGWVKVYVTVAGVVQLTTKGDRIRTKKIRCNHVEFVGRCRLGGSSV